MLKFEGSGDLKHTDNFLKSISDTKKILAKARISNLAEQGVRELENATPKRTGKTAASWSYSIEERGNKVVVSWNNSNIVNGVNIAIILQYGHSTKNGGYVQGRDYINPALRSIFDKMVSDMWKAVVSS